MLTFTILFSLSLSLSRRVDPYISTVESPVDYVGREGDVEEEDDLGRNAAASL